jgi:ABC-2 type transport system permease protein
VSAAEVELPLAPGAREMRGPTALGAGWRRLFDLTWLLAVTDFRLSYFGSALGYVWSLVRPLLFFGVLYVVFTKVLQVGGGIPHYPAVLLLNIVLYNFFAEATGASVQSLVVREALVRKMHFPRMAVPLASVLTAAFNLMLNLVAVLIFVLASGVSPQLTWLLFPFVLLPLVAFAIGIAMILSSLYVRFRDVAPIWLVVSQLLFYGSPIIYTIDKLRDRSVTAAHLVMLNPLADLLEQARRWIVGPSAKGAVDAAGGPVHALAPLAVFLGLIALGFWLFLREAPHVAENL